MTGQRIQDPGLPGATSAPGGKVVANLADSVARAAGPKPEHLFLGARAVTPPDFESAALSDPACDITMLEMRIPAAHTCAACGSGRPESQPGKAIAAEVDARWA